MGNFKGFEILRKMPKKPLCFLILCSACMAYCLMLMNRTLIKYQQIFIAFINMGKE